MNDNEDSWPEYSRLVLKELESLADGLSILKSDIDAIKQDMGTVKYCTERYYDLQTWKNRIDDVASPVQLKEHVASISDLKSFKTKAITIFAVIQFLMAFALFKQSMWS